MKDFAKCDGCQHFEDEDRAGCIKRVHKCGFDDCYSPHMGKHQHCITCGSRFIWTERDKRLFCRTCWDNREIKEVKA